MTIHFLLLALALIVLLVSVDKNHYKKIIFISSLIFFITAFIIITFRAETVGNDTHVYVDFFKMSALTSNFHILLESTRFESGYVALNYIISRLTNDYTIFFFVCNIINFFCTIYFFRKYCLNKNAWPFFWIIWGTYYLSFNTVRAGIAISLAYLFFDAVLQKKIPKAIIALALAVSFHTSALFCSIAMLFKVPLIQKITKHRIILVIAFLCMGIFLNQMMSLLPDYYQQYYTDSQWAEGGVRLASVMDFIFLSLFYIITTIRNPDKIDWQYYRDFRFFFLIGVGFSFLGIIFNLFNRIEMFFIPLAAIYILNSFKYIDNLRKLITLGTAFALTVYQIVSFMIRPEWLGIFPYYFR